MDNSQNPLDEAFAPATEPTTRQKFAAMTPDQQRDFVLTYQPPREDQIPKFVAVRNGIEAAYKAVEENCPPCADRSHTLRLLRDARMWANAAIALDGVV